MNSVYSVVPCMEEVGCHFLNSTWEGLCKEVENMHHVCLLPVPHVQAQRIWRETLWPSQTGPLNVFFSLQNSNKKSTERCQDI